MNTIVNIAVIEPSTIVFEGLVSIFQKVGLKCRIHRLDALDELVPVNARYHCQLVCINPSIVQHNSKLLQSLKCQWIEIKWIGLVYAYYDQQVIALFDAVISISDTPENMMNIVQTLLKKEGKEADLVSDILSDREIDVLTLLAKGMSNKEVADKLNISINTAITHRKNISQKTGIKSVSGLTIYAVVKKLISLENLAE